MDKMLHEQLVDWVDQSEKEGRFPTTVAVSETRDKGLIASAAMADKEERNFFMYLAEQINEQYIPRPRFEDGEFVQWNDESIDWIETKFGRPHSIDWTFNAVDNKGAPLAYARNSNEVRAVADVTEDGFVKRKHPKALDADGVEIKVGDTVWSTDPSTLYSCTVTEILNRSLIMIEWEDGQTDRCSAEAVTHKEPDSLEKLREDVDCMLRNLECDTDTADEIERRFFALIERGA